MLYTRVVLNFCMWRQYGSQQCHFPFDVPAAASGHDSVNYVNIHTFCVSCYCRSNLHVKHNAAY